MPPERRLLLVGAGHAHLHLLRHADRLAGAGYRTTLVAPRSFDYSGVAASVAAGGRDPAHGRIDVTALTRDAVDHLPTRVTQLDPVSRTATLQDGSRLPWDLVSVNVGSVAAVPEGVPVADSVVRVKPLADLARLRERLVRPAARGRGHRVTVVGAGASGLELAAHLAVRPDTKRVHLLEAGPRVGAFLPPRAAERLRRLLVRRGVVVRTGVDLARLDDHEVRLGDGDVVPHDVAVLATGLAAPPLATAGPLGGPAGLPVRATLRHRDHGDVYAVGDCAHFLAQPLPRIGVHGVRQGPVLLEALVVRGTGVPAPTYRPPRQALSVLDLGGGQALAVRGRWWWQGRASLLLKRAIDRRWVAGYRA